MVTGICRYKKNGFNKNILDEVYDLAKIKYKDDPVTHPPVPASGIIKNTVNEIWADMNDPNTGWVSNMRWMNQFKGPSKKDVTTQGKYTDLNLWIEIEAAGTGKSCSLDINKAINTRVEFGWTRGYLLMDDGNWVMFGESKNHEQPHGAGSQYPFPNKDDDGIFGSSRGCSTAVDDIVYGSMNAKYPILGFSRIEASGFKSIKPQSYFRWHGWAKNFVRPDYRKVRAVFGYTYVRLIVEDATKTDDRHSAEYVVHAASDKYDRDEPLDEDQYKGDLGISRYKKVTNDWQPVNFLSIPVGMTKAQFEANPPPIPTTP